MKTLSEFQIALVYYTGLGISLLLGILGIAYLKPKEAIKRIFPKSGVVWNYNFITTVLIAGVLGAISISFTDCNGGYTTAMDTTVKKGFDQISSATLCLSIILAAWFFIFVTIELSPRWKTGAGRVFKILGVISTVIFILGYYLVLYLNKN